jgi:molybdopterin-guanine dinucleotide biosynthesis protein B
MVAFTGFSSSGKTTLMSSVIEHLTARGYKVAAIKHDGCGHDISNQKAGSDSMRHKKAGAECTIVSNASGYSMECSTDADKTPEELASLFSPAIDIVLVEGFKRSNLPKIEIVRSGLERVCAGDPSRIAIASDIAVEGETIPVLDINDSATVADFVEAYLKEHRQEISLHLVVNGKPIPTKGFIQNMLTYSLHGLIKALKECDNPQEIIIKANYEK